MPGSSLPEKADVIICGAGPAGTAAALTLTHSGLTVILLDKTSFPRDKICGDALSGKVVSVAKYIDPQLLEDFYDFEEKVGSYGIRFLSPSGIQLDIPFKSDLTALAHPPGFVSKRIDFDNFMLEKTIACDHVQWFPNCGVTSISTDEEGVTVEAGGHQFRGNVVIGADGAHSVVAREAGLRRISKRHHSAGVRAYVNGVESFHSQNFIELHFLKDLLPGYFWVFPLPNGGANVGLGMLSSDLAKRPALNLRKRLLEILKSHPEISPRFQNAEIQGKVMGFGLPLGSRKLPISANRVLLTGDAASLIDPFSGEGIGNAMVSGRLAAKHIISLNKEGRFDAVAMKTYDKAVYNKLGPELRVSNMMQKLVNYPWLFDFVAKKGNRNPSVKALMTMMFESIDLRKELTRPGFYGSLLFGSKK